MRTTFDGKPVRGARSGCDSPVGVVRLLQCKSSEDGDGATVRRISKLESGILPVPLLFAVPAGSKQLELFVLRGENRHGE